MSEAYVIEAQLLRWGDNHNGRTVTLQLPADGEHPFKGLPCGPANGQRMALSVALIADDETEKPVESDVAARQQQLRDNNERARAEAERQGVTTHPRIAPEKPASGRNGNGRSRAQQAGACCQDVRFRAFLHEHPDCNMMAGGGSEDAKHAIYEICGVGSRAHLDTDPEAGRRWDRLYAAYVAELR